MLRKSWNQLKDIIEATFEANGQRLDVLTVAGLGDGAVTYQTLQEKLTAK